VAATPSPNRQTIRDNLHAVFLAIHQGVELEWAGLSRKATRDVNAALAGS
jgi:hypothetical protein